MVEREAIDRTDSARYKKFPEYPPLTLLSKGLNRSPWWISDCATPTAGAILRLTIGLGFSAEGSIGSCQLRLLERPSDSIGGVGGGGISCFRTTLGGTSMG